TGGRVGQVVQVLAYHGVADEVGDALVPVRHTDEAGRSEVPLHADVEVVGLERQQRRVLCAARGTELLAVEGRTARATCGRAGIQVAVRRAGDRLAERRTALELAGEVDAEVEVRQQVAVAGGLAERLGFGRGPHLEVVVRKPRDVTRHLDDRGRCQVGRLVTQADNRVGRK